VALFCFNGVFLFEIVHADDDGAGSGVVSVSVADGCRVVSVL
jgi:hypothetical protein